MPEVYYIAPGFPAEPLDSVVIRNAYIGDLQVANIAYAEYQIVRDYQSNALLPVDENTALKMNFDDSLYTAASDWGIKITNGLLITPRVVINEDNYIDENGIHMKAISNLQSGLNQKAFELQANIDSLSSSISQLSTEIITVREEAQSLIAQTATSIGATIDQTIMDFETMITNKYRTDIQATADAINLTLSQYTVSLNSLVTDVANIKTNFRFDASGLTIGKSDSPFSINISNSQINFLENGSAVAWINGQKMYITSAEIVDNIRVGNHLIDKYNDTITLVRWVG